MSDTTVVNLAIQTPARPKLRIYRPTTLGEVVAHNLGQITFMAAQAIYNFLAFHELRLCTAQLASAQTNVSSPHLNILINFNIIVPPIITFLAKTFGLKFCKHFKEHPD